MKTKVYPLILTTWEALENSLPCSIPVLYIDEFLYGNMPEKICEALAAHGYYPGIRQGKHGIFFSKNSGNNMFEPEKQEIYDPMDIL